jgi:CRISPR/Cas system-associated exonuclease Cas4 (RecB family)
MRVALEDIKDFSKCPRYYHFLKDTKTIPTNKRVEAFRHAIERAYTYQQNGSKPTWRKMMGWVDTVIFKDIDVTNDSGIEKGRAISESVLLPLRSWYDKVFVNEHVEGFANTPIEWTTAGHQFYGIAPVIKLTDPITIMIMGGVVVTHIQLYNDILARSIGLVAAKQLNQDRIKVEHLLIGPSRALESTVLDCDEELNRRTSRAIVQIANSIAKKVNYPSITSMCNECPFRKDCIL